MKTKLHYLFYLIAVVSIIGTFARWPWVIGTFDHWSFPLLCVVLGNLVRERNRQAAGTLERVTVAFQKFALGSMIASMVLMGGLMFYADHVHEKAEREAIKAYLDARKAAGLGTERPAK